MTANVAQVFLTDDDWTATLHGIRDALKPGGHIVLESRVPERRAWLEWGREQTWKRTDLPGVGVVETWTELTGERVDLVSFRATYLFEQDGAVLTSDSTLRFRGRDEIERSLEDAGFDETVVRDAPDRPGREHVFVARRQLGAHDPRLGPTQRDHVPRHQLATPTRLDRAVDATSPWIISSLASEPLSIRLASLRN